MSPVSGFHRNRFRSRRRFRLSSEQAESSLRFFASHFLVIGSQFQVDALDAHIDAIGVIRLVAKFERFHEAMRIVGGQIRKAFAAHGPSFVSSDYSAHEIVNSLSGFLPTYRGIPKRQPSFSSSQNFYLPRARNRGRVALHGRRNIFLTERDMARFAFSILLILLVLCETAHSQIESAPETSNDQMRATKALQESLQLPEPISDAQLSLLDQALPRLSEKLPGSIPARQKLASIRFNSPDAFNFDTRIVGGTEVGATEARWQVGLVISGYPMSQAPFCGGSAISPRWILTAAHCVDTTHPNDIKVFYGSRDVGASGALASVATIVIHPDWDPNTMLADIALVELSNPLQVGGSGVQLIPMSSSAPEDGRLFHVTGWGRTSEGGQGSARLRKVVVPKVNIEDCNSASFYNGSIGAGMFCAGIGGRDSCQGDSGGPLVAGFSDGPSQFGVVSWGHGCARPNKPGVYTDVAYFSDWIMEVTQ